MEFNITEIDNGYLIKGRTLWHGSFECFEPTFARAVSRVTKIKAVADRKANQ